MSAKRARVLKAIRTEGVIAGEVEDRVDHLRGIKGAEQIHAGYKRTIVRYLPCWVVRVSRVTRVGGSCFREESARRVAGLVNETSNE